MFERLMKIIEETKITATGFIGAFLSIVAIRIALEGFSSPSANGFFPVDPLTVVNYTTYFLALYLLVSCCVGLCTGSYVHAAKIVLFGFIIIWIPPSIDLIITGGSGSTLTYIFASPQALTNLFVSFLGSVEDSGVTIGLRVALSALLIVVGWYIFKATKNVFRACGGVFLVYTTIFLLGSMPSILYSISLVGGGADTSITEFIQETVLESGLVRNAVPGTLVPFSALVTFETGFNLLMSCVFTLISVIAGVCLLYGINKRAVLAHAKNARVLRTLHFLFLVGIGALIGLNTYPSSLYGWPDILGAICLVISFVAACWFAIGTNDLEDEGIDTISNKERPLITKTLSREEMRNATAISFFIMCSAGWSAGYYPLFFILAFTAVYYAYSAPPLRLKRVPILSSVLIGTAALFAVCAGFFFVVPEKASGIFDTMSMFGIIIFYGLLAHFRDLKDIRGDSAAGVATLATVITKRWGERRAFQITGGILALAFLSTPLFFPVSNLWLVASIAALLSYGVCVIKPYRESLFFYILFAFFLAVGLLVIFS